MAHDTEMVSPRAGRRSRRGMNRRRFLGLSAASLALTAPLIGRPWSAAAQPGRPRLQMPPLLDTRASGRLQLTALAGETSVLGGPPAPTAGYNAGFMGPTIVMQNGPLALRLENKLHEPVTAHWHGMLVPGEHDGGPHRGVAPGEVWRADMQIGQRPNTAWYHSHPHGATARHLYAGLAGVIHQTDGRDDQRGLPSRYGIDDLTLIVQDRRFDDNGRMVYIPESIDILNGFHGERILVNGQFDKTAAVPRGVVRLRFLNASNARIYNFHFSDRRPFHLIATDGGLLPKPVEMTYLRMAPAERAEILVDFATGPAPVLMSASGLATKILEFAVDEKAKARITRLPNSLDADVPTAVTEGLPTRSFTLNMGGGSTGEFAPTTDAHSGHGASGPHLIGAGPGGELGVTMNDFGINGRAYDMGRIDFQAKLGSYERWLIGGGGVGVIHPFHVHGVHFRVLSTAGARPGPEDSGWKDTCLVAGQIEILVRFERTAGPTAPFMYHCHILEHEDSGMMGQFTVV